MSTVPLPDGRRTPVCEAAFIDLLTSDVDGRAGALAEATIAQAERRQRSEIVVANYLNRSHRGRSGRGQLQS